MEKKTKHRILGIMVVIAVVIVSLPLFQGAGRESDATLVNAPAFPDQSMQVDASQTVDMKTPASVPVQTSPIPMHDPSADTGINQTPDDTIAPNALPSQPPTQAPAINQPDNGLQMPKPNSNNTPNPADNAGTGADDSEPNPNENSIIDNETPPAKNAQRINDAVTIEAPKKPLVTTPKMRSTTVKPKASDTHGLAKLKQSGWVIQLGSFKNKENALRLVNKLRLKGYHAFIQQADARTRVFVGPENKQQIARMVASQLEEEMHVSGVVISYKPLSL